MIWFTYLHIHRFFRCISSFSCKKSHHGIQKAPTLFYHFDYLYVFYVLKYDYRKALPIAAMTTIWSVSAKQKQILIIFIDKNV